MITMQPFNSPNKVGASLDPLLTLALVALQAGQHRQAQALATQALQGNPRLVPAYLVLSKASRAGGQVDLAIQHCHAALSIAPGSVPALIEMAVSQRQAGLTDEAEQTYRQAIGLAPSEAVLHHNLANLLQRRGAWPESETHYLQALALAPHFVEAHTELGRLREAQGQHDDARQSYAQALALRPDFAPAWKLLNASLNQSDPVQGIHDLQRGAPDGQTSPRVLMVMANAALRLDPDNALGHYTLGLSLRLQGQLVEAMVPLEKALALAPPHGIAQQCLYLLTLCLMDRGDITAALPRAQSLLTLSEAQEEQAKSHQLLASLHFEAGDLARAWPAYRQAIELAPNFLPAKASFCAANLYAAGVDAAQQQQLANDLIGPIEHGITPRRHGNDREPTRRLRVGYLSGDFREHSCAYFLEPLLKHHDPAQVELFAYVTERAEDEVTQRLKQHMAHWHRVFDLSDDALATRIQEDGIDILVDLAGLTDGSRLPALARKPAPVQISWLGYLGPTGLRAIDHRLTDELVDDPRLGTMSPPGRDAPLRLPRPYLCYQPPLDAPPVTEPPMLKRGYPTFGSFNALTKLSEPCLALWCKVLHALPDARLLIKTRALRDDALRESLLARLAAHGLDPERVTLMGWSPATAHHLALYGDIDVALDSTPFNGVTTTCEASWMGVPVVSRVGDTIAARQGLTLLHALGCADQAVDSDEAFVQRCLDLVAHPQALALQRADLRDRMAASPLMDGAGFARSVEAAYRGAWQDWCASSTLA